MAASATSRLKAILASAPDKIRAIDHDKFVSRPAPGKWSRKEILGHLVDSAANNHQRFIRAQYEQTPVIVYDQDRWNTLNNYQALDDEHVIRLWTIYNQHLLEVIRNIPPENLTRKCRTNEKEHTLQFLIDDYVDHLEYHLGQIIDFRSEQVAYGAHN